MSPSDPALIPNHLNNHDTNSPKITTHSPKRLCPSRSSYDDTPDMSLTDTERALVLSHLETFQQLLNDLDRQPGDTVEAQRLRERMRGELDAVEKVIEKRSEAPNVS